MSLFFKMTTALYDVSMMVVSQIVALPAAAQQQHRVCLVDGWGEFLPVIMNTM